MNRDKQIRKENKKKDGRSDSPLVNVATNLRRHFGGKNQQKESNLELNGGVDSEVRADRQWEVLTHKFTQSNSLQKNTITGLAPLNGKSGSKDHIVKCKLLEGLQAIVFN